ncbi:MAG: YdeI/OmpD-associated family protein [Pseudomonadota bacterium]
MVDPAYPHLFDAEICAHDVGPKRYRYTVVYLPDSLAVTLGLRETPRLRIEGEIEDFPFAGALQPAMGVWYLMVPAEIRAATGCGLGDTVHVRFRVGDQDHVDKPRELTDVLAENGAAAAAWAALTPGAQRGWAYVVSKPKRAETRERKAVAVAAALVAGTSLRDF